jgi:predicted aspartyl protease
MTARFVIATVCAAAGLLAALPASAACSLKTNQIPVTMRGLRPMVSAKVNGQKGDFLLDSGSFINSLNGKFAGQLKLKPLGVRETGTLLDVPADTAIQGVAGAITLNGLVKADKFELEGGGVFKDVGFMATSNFTEAEGLIGQAFLKSVDVEYDLQGGVVRLAKAQGCQGANMAYWAKDGQAISVLPLEWIDRDRPMTQAAVYVNGVRLRATFDTGAGWSFITESAAARAGVRTSDPGVVGLRAGRGLDGRFNAWEGTFASIKVGDEEIKNAPLEIGESATNAFDVLIGADFFLSHHIYVANSQDKIYFTYSGGPVFQARPPPTAKTAQAAVQK